MITYKVLRFTIEPHEVGRSPVKELLDKSLIKIINYFWITKSLVFTYMYSMFDQVFPQVEGRVSLIKFPAAVLK
jgi:hypothetical protein